jgi:hypothetical protein
MSIDWERRTETGDFWVGEFPSWEVFSGYVGEDPRYYELMDTEDAVPLSWFIRDQGAEWFDHDMGEMGFKANAGSVAELVKGYSYADQYADELARRAENVGLTAANGFVFIRGGVIEEPRSVTTTEFRLLYVGQITYRL